ncbi:MAG: hypothetical protein JKX90_01380 [Colwellia sp.]|jgi:hypothetical protein|nr:hypothetical protein [Colwellia sp.]
MNIIPQAPNLSIPTVLNPHTESLRRENNQREIITQPAALNQSAAEKGVSSDKERGRTPAQNSENIDFASLKEKAELANNSISEQKGDQHSEHKEQENKNSAQHSAINQTADDENSNDSAASDFDNKNAQQQVINELQLQGSHPTTTADSNENSLAIGSNQKDESETDNELSFDAFMNKTLTAQEQIAPTQSTEVLQRAVRVETFYANIMQAYEKPARYQFQLTA